MVRPAKIIRLESSSYSADGAEGTLSRLTEVRDKYLAESEKVELPTSAVNKDFFMNQMMTKDGEEVLPSASIFVFSQRSSFTNRNIRLVFL